MVHEDESSDDYSSLQYMNSSDDDSMLYRIPASIEDQDYMGIETGTIVPCQHHGLPCERRVAFEGFDTGRRFLACPLKEGQNSGSVEWVDPEWPPTMQNALLKLWEMYQDSRSDRRKDNLESSLTIHHLTEEKNKLEANYDKLVEDVHQLLNAQEDRVLDFRYLQSKMESAEERKAEVTNSVVSDMKTEMEKKDAEIFKLQGKYEVLMNLTKSQGTVIRNMKFNHLKEKEVHSASMRNLQFQVEELTKSMEKLKQENLKLMQVDEVTKSQEELTQENQKLKDHIGDLKKGHDKLIQENLQLKGHMGDLKKGHDKLTKDRAQLKLQIADMLKAEEKNKQKMKGIQAILDE
ncbi:hypothetical protein ACQJBY_055888 [Aegilops geniculata]